MIKTIEVLKMCTCDWGFQFPNQISSSCLNQWSTQCQSVCFYFMFWSHTEQIDADEKKPFVFPCDTPLEGQCVRGKSQWLFPLLLQRPPPPTSSLIYWGVKKKSPHHPISRRLKAIRAWMFDFWKCSTPARISNLFLRFIHSDLYSRSCCRQKH